MPVSRKPALKSKSTRRSGGGKKAGTPAGAYVREEMRHFKEGVHDKKHPIRSPKQAVAIGLSKARRARKAA